MSTDNVLAPEQFNERWTVWLNAEGKPVEKTLRQMTGAEVLIALEWHGAEAERLRREAAPCDEFGKQAQAGTLDRDSVSDDELNTAVWTLRAAAEAALKAARLLSMVRVQMPKWRGSKLPFKDALRRWWPGGRHPPQVEARAGGYMPLIWISGSANDCR